MVQFPAVTMVTVLPATVHTPGVCELNVTASPDDAVALTANGGLLVRLLGMGVNVMV